MGWNYRKRIKLLPGVYLNISKTGLGVSVGFPGVVNKIIKQIDVTDDESKVVHDYFGKHKKRESKK